MLLKHRMFKFYLLLVLIVCAQAQQDDEVYSATRRIIDNGFPAEEHFVTTEDGYILGLQRIPYGRNQSQGDFERPVVLLMHGLYSLDNSFLLLGPEYGIGYTLADAGFDVWLGNSRGSINSRRHTSLNPDDPEEKVLFFNFSFEEIGMFDVSAYVDYILAYTGRTKLHYIGHSQGGTVFLILNSMRPEYNEKFISANLLAGVGYMYNFPNLPLRVVARFSDTLHAIGLAINLVEVGHNIIDAIINYSNDTSTNYEAYCFNDSIYKDMCTAPGIKEELRSALIDIDISDIENMFALFGGGSLKQLVHYGQNVRDKKFRRWNFGTIANLRVYGTREPPTYNLSLITVPTVNHYTILDELLDERDVLAMARDMPNTEARKIESDTFTHVNFVDSPDVKHKVTVYVIDNIWKAQIAYDEENQFEENDEDTDEGDESYGNSANTLKLGVSRTNVIILCAYLFISHLLRKYEA